MKAKETKPTTPMVRVSEKALLSLVAAQLKGRELFPEKVANAKKYLKDIKSVPF